MDNIYVQLIEFPNATVFLLLTKKIYKFEYTEYMLNRKKNTVEFVSQ